MSPSAADTRRAGVSDARSAGLRRAMTLQLARSACRRLWAQGWRGAADEFRVGGAVRLGSGGLRSIE